MRIESLERQLSLVSTISLEPQPIPTGLKVVLIGSRQLFDLCEQRGLSGEQGVIIPHSNVRHLMLKQAVHKASAENGLPGDPGLTAGQRSDWLRGACHLFTTGWTAAHPSTIRKMWRDMCFN